MRGKDDDAYAEDDNVVVRFVAYPGQVLFDGRDIGLPTGLCVDVMAALVTHFGRVVPYAELHRQSLDVEASVELRGAVMRIRRALEEHGVPCRVETKRRGGYVLCCQ